MPPRTAVILPCYNEAAAIADVVATFRQHLPTATVYVYDNNSSDDTAEVARGAGAIVYTEPMQGKGNVIRRMFADVDADIYVMADGDGTYDAASAPRMVDRLIGDNLDMVVGTRKENSDAKKAYRPGHRFGNAVLTGFTGMLFGNRFNDMLSGYRVFSRRFVKSFPALASGFETETELAIHALSLRLPVAEVETPYADRAEGTESKLNTWRDGIRILLTILFLFKEFRPFPFFGAIFTLLFLAGLGMGAPVVFAFLETGLVERLPTAILATGVMTLAFLSLTAGLVLDSVSRGRVETKRLAYLSLPPPSAD